MTSFLACIIPLFSKGDLLYTSHAGTLWQELWLLIHQSFVDAQPVGRALETRLCGCSLAATAQAGGLPPRFDFPFVWVLHSVISKSLVAMLVDTLWLGRVTTG